MSTVVNVAELGRAWAKEVHDAFEKDDKFIPTNFPYSIIEARDRLDAISPHAEGGERSLDDEDVKQLYESAKRAWTGMLPDDRTDPEDTDAGIHKMFRRNR
ncbi:hypothetical protein [Sorangium sp. So ce1000]|uniref:hypothetical protein n=1 Tax=Sorangium sp. So ce1000 TaxID=3133325 RepID=UPI003F610AAF